MRIVYRTIADEIESEGRSRVPIRCRAAAYADGQEEHMGKRVYTFLLP
jgi:hypothetical protein